MASNLLLTTGEKVRKGTIAASINNIKRLDKLLSKKGAELEIRDIIKDQHSLNRGLYATDFLEMQPIMNWLRDAKKLGKIMVAILILQDCPEIMTDQIRLSLQAILKDSHPHEGKNPQNNCFIASTDVGSPLARG